MRNKKGVGLIIAVSITVVMFILGAGLFPIIMRSISQTHAKKVKQELFYAAESGLNHGLRKLQMASLNDFNTGSVSDLDGHSFVIDGMKVDIVASFSKTEGWHLSSVASFESGSKRSSGKSSSVSKCSNSLTGIQGSSLVGNAVAMASSMSNGLEFASSGSSVDQGDLYAATDMILGNQYFGGILNMQGVPVFDGEVTSASTYESERKIETSSFASSSLTSLLRTISEGRYSSGIWDKTSYDTDSYSSTQMENRFSDVFPSGYNGNQPPVDFFSNVVNTYDQILTYGNTYELDSKYTEAEVTITGSDVEIIGIDRNGYTTTINFPLSDDKNIIAIPSDCNTVRIQESIIGSDVSIVAEDANIEIKGDIYYEGLENYDDMTKAWGADSDNIDMLQDLINDIDQKFGLIAYEGDVTIHNDVGDSESEIEDDCLLLNGAFFCPDGTFGVDGGVYSGNSYYTNANNFAGSKRVINIGSVMMDTKGLYRVGSTKKVFSHYEWKYNQRQHRWYQSAVYEYVSTSKGITATLASDDRFSDQGLMPLGFKQLIVQNPTDGLYYVILATSGMEWDSKYE